MESDTDCQWLFSMPTPPSSTGSPSNDVTVSVSTTFHPEAQLDPRRAPPDIVLLSSDGVFFYVHSSTLLRSSQNRFAGLLDGHYSTDDEPTVIHLQNDSATLNILLLCLYHLPCSQFEPTFDILVQAIELLPVFGHEPKHLITPSTSSARFHPSHMQNDSFQEVYTVLLSHAPLRPLDLYALAAHFDIHDLAVATSSHLLSYSLPNLTDEISERIGAKYLKRLFFLHVGRSEALKRVLLAPPHPHAPTSSCDFADQKKLTRAWALASAYLAWDARPDLSTSTMESALSPLGEHLACDDCKDALRERIKTLVVQWSLVRRTI